MKTKINFSDVAFTAFFFIMAYAPLFFTCYGKTNNGFADFVIGSFGILGVIAIITVFIAWVSQKK